jgi:hypothetical protein
VIAGRGSFLAGIHLGNRLDGMLVLLPVELSAPFPLVYLREHRLVYEPHGGIESALAISSHTDIAEKITVFTLESFGFHLTMPLLSFHWLQVSSGGVSASSLGPLISLRMHLRLGLLSGLS